jgi:hypothetical protein
MVLSLRYLFDMDVWMCGGIGYECGTGSGVEMGTGTVENDVGIVECMDAGIVVEGPDVDESDDGVVVESCG